MDPRPLLLRTIDQFEKLLTAVTPESLERPTPCTEFRLRALLGHTVGAIHRIAYIGEGGRALDVAAAVAQIADGDWPGAVLRARARVAAAWADDAELDPPVELPWGVFPGRVALSAYVMEVATHTWDAARTLGAATTELDPELAEFAFQVAKQALPPEQERGADVPFNAPRPAPADADGYTRLAAWLGRKTA